MASESASRAAGVIRTFGLASGVLDRQELRDLEVACEASKMILDRKAEDLVRSAHGMPILSSKSCDGTPLNIFTSTKWDLGTTGKKQHTKGRKGAEFLVGHQFLRTKGLDGVQKTAVRLAEAVPLGETSASATLTAAMKSWKWLRQLGHRGCAIEHFVWDRKGFSKLERDTRRWDEVRADVGTCPPHLSQEDHELTNFILVTPCALHDLQNGFKWGLKSQVEDTSLMRDLYITVESLRNSMDLLSSQISSWVCLRMAFHEDRGEEWKQSQMQLFQVLQLDPMVSDLVVEELQLCWSDDRLWIKDDAQV